MRSHNIEKSGFLKMLGKERLINRFIDFHVSSSQVICAPGRHRSIADAENPRARPTDSLVSPQKPLL